MSKCVNILPLTALLLFSGCASLPNGPAVLVLPGTGIPFDQFRGDDVTCQQFAMFQVGGTSPNDAGLSSGVTSAAVGTALGAAAGAAIGGSGAAIGAGSGLVAGGLVGTGMASSSRYGTQQRYDSAYIQCMYAKGHQVPVSGQFSNPAPHQATPSAATIPPPPSGIMAPPSGNIPPPPPGSPPPPPQ